MIDFQNSAVFKLKPMAIEKIKKEFHLFLIEEEEVFAAFKTIRDQLIFTNKRVIAANVQGITGSKVDYTSLPFSKVQAFSVETAGTFDLDCELELYFSELGKVKFEFKGGFDVVRFNRLLSVYIL